MICGVMQSVPACGLYKSIQIFYISSTNNLIVICLDPDRINFKGKRADSFVNSNLLQELIAPISFVPLIFIHQ